MNIIKHIFHNAISPLMVACGLLLLFATPAIAQVSVSAKLDSVQMFVGQQDGLELQVTLTKGKRIEWPVLQDGAELMPNVEVVRTQNTDTLEINDGSQLQVTRRYIITAWDSSLYLLPPLKVMVDGKNYASKRLAIKVLTIDVDTLHKDVFAPPRPIQNQPFCWDDWKGVTYSSIAILLLIGVCIYLWMRIRSGKPVFRLVRRRRKLPPHQVALTEIEQLKQERSWLTGDSKEYYTQLTDTLRRYIQERFGFSAMEMTSHEIIQHLKDNGDEQSLSELREIFSTADLVKFAKWTPQINENDANLISALNYVNETKQEVDPATLNEPEIVKETDKERLTQVTIMRVVIAISAVIVAGLLGWIIYRVIDLIR